MSDWRWWCQLDGEVDLTRMPGRSRTVLSCSRVKNDERTLLLPPECERRRPSTPTLIYDPQGLTGAKGMEERMLTLTERTRNQPPPRRSRCNGVPEFRPRPSAATVPSSPSSSDEADRRRHHEVSQQWLSSPGRNLGGISSWGPVSRGHARMFSPWGLIWKSLAPAETQSACRPYPGIQY